MLTFTSPEGAPILLPASAIDEVRAGAFSALGGGSRLLLVRGDVVPVMEDADSIEAMLGEAGLTRFDRPEITRVLGDRRAAEIEAEDERFAAWVEGSISFA